MRSHGIVNCQEFEWIATAVVVSVTSISLATILIFLYQYVSNYVTSIKSLFYTGLTFILCVCFAFISYLMLEIFLCIDDKLFYLSETIFAVFYSLQFYILLLILFMRLYFIFHNSALQLSKMIITFYTFLFCMIPILVGMVLVTGFRSQFGSILIVGVVSFLLMLILSILVLFLTRLSIVYQHCHNDDELIDIITKTTNLTFLSVFLTLLIPINNLWQSSLDFQFGSLHYFMGNILTICDLYTNLLCVVMSYSYFDPCYQKLCGCCHAKCKSMCSFICKKKQVQDIKMISFSVNNQSQSGSSQSIEIQISAEIL